MFLQSSHSSWRSRYISHIHTILKCYSFVECTLSVSFSNLVNFSTDFTFFFYVLCTYFWMCWSTETYSVVVIGTCTLLQGVNIVLGCGNLGASTRATSFYFAFTALTELLNSPNVCYCCYHYTIEKKKQTLYFLLDMLYFTVCNKAWDGESVEVCCAVSNSLTNQCWVALASPLPEQSLYN